MTLLTRVLKGRMGFDGLVVGDWNGHAQLPGCTPVRCAAALDAGVDVLMAPDGWRELYVNTLAQVRSGEIAATRLDDAVRRVLRVKLRAHLDTEGAAVDAPLRRALRAPRRPAAPGAGAPGGARVAGAAEEPRPSAAAVPARSACWWPATAPTVSPGSRGGWTIDWQGTEPNQDFPHAESIFAGIARVVRAAGGTAELSAAGEFHTRPDVAIVVFGESPYAEYAGDVPTLEYCPGDKHDLALLGRLRAADVPVVAVFLSGRPLWVNAELNAADSFVAAWLPGPQGGALADVLFRAADGRVAYDFRGKLPFSWPRSPRPPRPDGAGGGAGLPGEAPLFPFGYGLTYAGRRLRAAPARGGSGPGRRRLVAGARAHRHPGQVGVRDRADIEVARGGGHARERLGDRHGRGACRPSWPCGSAPG